MATIANFKVPTINNEPNVSSSWKRNVKYQLTSTQQHYTKGSADRQKLQDAIATLKKRSPIDVPLAVGGQYVRAHVYDLGHQFIDSKQIKDSSVLTQHDPSSHTHVIAKYSNASTAEVNTAIDSALAAKPAWESLPFADRAAVFLKAADLISTKYRYEIMATTMVGQGKNAWQAEIDAAAELCDFLR